MWRRVFFTDQKIFRVRSNRRSIYTTRAVGERLNTHCITSTIKSGAQIHVWAGIGYNGFSALKVIQGNLNAQRYQEVVLADIQEVGRPCTVRNAGWIFMQDLAPAHNAASTRQFLLDRRVNVLPWPGNSPDMNPIEHVWNYVQRRLFNRLPRNQAELLAQIQAEWARVPLPYIKTLVNSMPRRVAAVCASKGAATRY